MCSLVISMLFFCSWGILAQSVSKRGVYDGAFYGPREIVNVVPVATPPLHNVLIHKPFFIPAGLSPKEIAAAIIAAKEASANVMAAQQRVQVAKNELITQQKLAAHKEAQATLALQQTEAAATVQRQQASAATNAVVLAQQRLAQAKAEVADKQRVASEKEGLAAVAIHRSASLAAEQLRRSETTADKISEIQSTEAALEFKHVAAAKHAALDATAAAIAAATHGHVERPWIIPAAHLIRWI